MGGTPKSPSLKVKLPQIESLVEQRVSCKRWDQSLERLFFSFSHEGVGQYILLGTTLDDAVGECFDKVARMLGLSGKQHGGKLLEDLAAQGNPLKHPFPVGLSKASHLQTVDFSFSGLKAAVRRHCDLNELETSVGAKADVAASFQHAAVSQLTDRLVNAMKWWLNMSFCSCCAV